MTTEPPIDDKTLEDLDQAAMNAVEIKKQQKIQKTLLGFDIEQPKPKIFQYRGERLALRLEPPFIRTLTAMARQNNMRIGEFVCRLKDRHDGKNFSSYIRALCMANAERDLIGYKAMSKDNTLEFFMENCPIPGLLLSEEQQIHYANKAFFDWTGNTPSKFREHFFHDFFNVRQNQSIRDLLFRIKLGHQKQASISVTYIKSSVPLSATGIFAPHASENNEQVSFILWLKTSQSQRPARIMKIPKR